MLAPVLVTEGSNKRRTDSAFKIGLVALPAVKKIYPKE
jgi:hypothetical protein